VRLVFVCLGINDIGLSNESAEHIISALKQAALQIRAQGLIAVGCTLMPFEGYTVITGYFSPEKDAIRQAVNAYLRGTHDFHKVIDFDQVVRDPAAPTHLRADLDSGDHLHPNDAGLKAMGEAVDLGPFR